MKCSHTSAILLTGQKDATRALSACSALAPSRNFFVKQLSLATSAYSKASLMTEWLGCMAPRLQYMMRATGCTVDAVQTAAVNTAVPLSYSVPDRTCANLSSLRGSAGSSAELLDVAMMVRVCVVLNVWRADIGAFQMLQCRTSLCVCMYVYCVVRCIGTV